MTLLPFDLPAPSVLRAMPKKVFAHYFPVKPISLDNKVAASDYYTRNLMDPAGEGGVHAAYGGQMRDRPLPQDPVASTDWKLQNMRREVRQAIAYGLDGFIVDIMQLEGGADTNQWPNVVLLLQAAIDVDPGFKIMLMPDMSGPSMAGKDVPTMAAALAKAAAFSSAYRLADGRLVVAPFKAEAHDAAWWKSLMDTMKASYSITVALIPCFVGLETPYLPTFAPISYGATIWGSRNPAWNSTTSTSAGSPRARAAAIKAAGLKWMQPVSIQDARPNQSVFDEAGNTENLRATWELARLTDAEFVQIPTWNDYTEGTSLAPSAQHGTTLLELNAYFLTWYKTGTAPRIVRDAVYLTHRTHAAAAKPSYAQTKLMKLRGGTAARDTVEALTLLTSPAKLTVAGASTDVPAGMTATTVPLAVGPVTATLERFGAAMLSLTSPVPVTATPYVQDMGYVAASAVAEPVSVEAALRAQVATLQAQVSSLTAQLADQTSQVTTLRVMVVQIDAALQRGQQDLLDVLSTTRNAIAPLVASVTPTA